MIQRAKAYFKEEWLEELNNYIRNYDFDKDRIIVQDLEKSFSYLTDRNYCLAVNSASNGIFMALYVWSKRYPDKNEVIIPNWGYPASFKACKVLNLKPVPVDIDIQSLGMDPTKILESLTDKTLGVVHVENNGVVGFANHIKNILPENVLYIEDAAPSLAQKNAGFYGDVSIFSFSPTKPLFCGEGGILLTDDGELNRELEQLRHTPHYGDMGGSLNFNMSPFLAAYLLPQLKNLAEIGEVREKVHNQYKKLLNIFGETFNRHGSIMYLSPRASYISKKLLSLRIDHRYKYYPLYSDNYKKFPNSHKVYDEIIDLPMHHELTDNEIKFICRIIRKVEDE